MAVKLTKKVPTNIITGFLGVGKTTAILSLLKQKPENESWAVLVNEFGEVGVDGAFLSEQGALVKEVPGGCMCCVAGLPMAIGINALLAQNPDRLLIEPTGLGHPKDIIGKLLSEHYANYIELNATITLVDPRNFADARYTENQNFRDQLALADVVVANKTDLSSVDDIAAFDDYVASSEIPKQASGYVEQGQLNPDWLMLPRIDREAQFAHHHSHDDDEMPAFELAPGEKFRRKENKGQGYVSCGWVFEPNTLFPFDSLYGLFANLNAERVKAVMNTDDGMFAFNVVNQIVSVSPISLTGVESRAEVIDKKPLPWDELEEILLSFVMK
ncbi:GTPase [Enterovibrio norvegicus FF-33]|uniref:GTPase n=1 Tax=Enterovibrio norvegicus FF-454 TaxID=1185651 RepID=A0A1E5CBJ0_9GAMM|nr:GTP-binding protein [Enterovibrio norvegicus]OEE62871.1 GTPase [Enterovibrio norvegicus FF-454]OEE66795.1 GTPase [Enterovibrio norvegicus FF-33]OEE76568.1 GTPase [Enterovibrio norvegicus FF-162]